MSSGHHPAAMPVHRTAEVPETRLMFKPTHSKHMPEVRSNALLDSTLKSTRNGAKGPKQPQDLKHGSMRTYPLVT